MLGIPTRSDVTNADYAELVKGARFFNTLSTTFALATGYALIDSHIAFALSQTGKDPDAGYLEGKRRLPYATLHQLSPQGIFRRHVAYMEYAKALIKTNPLLLEKPLCAKVWRAQEDGPIYNALVGELYGLENDLWEAYECSSMPVVQLEKMRAALEKRGNKEVFKFPKMARKELAASLRRMEEDDPEVSAMAADNKRIKKISDISLRFDESHVDTPYGLIPAEGSLINAEAHAMNAYGLHVRAFLRDVINQVAPTTGGVVINGVKYLYLPAGYLHMPAGAFLHFMTMHRPPQETVNVIGTPVIFDTGTAEPDGWAAAELKLVDNFRKGAVAAGRVADLYERFRDPLVRTEETALSYVSGSLGKNQ